MGQGGGGDDVRKEETRVLGSCPRLKGTVPANLEREFREDSLILTIFTCPPSPLECVSSGEILIIFASLIFGTSLNCLRIWKVLSIVLDILLCSK